MKNEKSVYPDQIIFIDGYCVMCNSFAGLIMKIDKKNIIHFTSLQGETADKLLSPDTIEKIDSIVYRSGSEYYYKAQAINKLFMDLGGIFSLYQITRIIPFSIQNKIYDFISRNRYSILKKRTTCVIPHKVDKQRILK